MLSQLIFVFLLIQAYMALWFLVSLILKRNDVADFAWGLGFILVALVLFLRWSVMLDHLGIITVLTGIWGTRLALHIGKRLISRGEDSRYLKWRQEWGKSVILRSFLQVFVLQGIIMFLICFSAAVASVSRGLPLSMSVYVGVFIWALGFIIESVADHQLSEFVVSPENKGHVMQTGLWRYSRHPNYFGEVTQWWGLFVIALSLPFGWLAVISPLTITAMILFVSGIPLLEEKYAGRPEFEEYKKKTSIFIPWFPKG